MDDDAWAAVLLPKLLQDSSIRTLTATCQALKLLCQRFHTRLNLTSLTGYSEPNQVDAYTAALPERFPAVSSIDLAITHESSYRCISVALPALARCVVCWHAQCAAMNVEVQAYSPTRRCWCSPSYPSTHVAPSIRDPDTSTLSP